MPNSPSQMIPDKLDWRQMWGSGRPRKDSNSAETSNFLVRGTTPNGGVEGWVASSADHAMYAMIPNVLEPGAIVWFEKTQGPLMKVLHVPGWRPMKQLAVLVHFLRLDGLLNDWSVESVLSLVFV
ncbi:uncharacterized protein TNCV_3578831 [Trichonephila clavipes]|nr:uncharacterized protein TNCV_3578831 [Trichonephila clavipes]